MKLGTRILLAVFLIIASGFYYLTHDILENIRVRYLEGVEESLVDGARILASLVSHEMETGEFAPEELEQALSNLVRNAIDFSSPGGTIRITTGTTGMSVYFSVEDRGPGIPDYARDRLFEKFVSLQRPGNNKKSTGLGLNFVKEIADLHQREIKLENRPNGGTRATLTLPK